MTTSYWDFIAACLQETAFVVKGVFMALGTNQEPAFARAHARSGCYRNHRPPAQYRPLSVTLCRCIHTSSRRTLLLFMFAWLRHCEKITDTSPSSGRRLLLGRESVLSFREPFQVQFLAFFLDVRCMHSSYPSHQIRSCDIAQAREGEARCEMQ